MYTHMYIMRTTLHAIPTKGTTAGDEEAVLIASGGTGEAWKTVAGGRVTEGDWLCMD